MRRALVAGNWKMNGSSNSVRALATSVAQGMAGVEIAVFPPFVFIPPVREALEDSSVRLGAQNCAGSSDGAFTGEVSASMLRDVGCTMVLVGHSERRTLYGETSAEVARKFALAAESGVEPILCLGETLAEREAGTTEAVVAAQLDAVIEIAGTVALKDAVIAYEPVWAIGTGKTASPEQANEVHAFIRQRIAARDAEVAAQATILYGGSVKADNADRLFEQSDIDGGLIGGAALDAEQFLAICRAAA